MVKILLCLEDEFTPSKIGLDGLSLMDAPVENLHAERIQDLLLDDTLERTRSVGGIVPLPGKVAPGLVTQFQMELLDTEPLLQTGESALAVPP